uniref:Uncharacterized protein n=1 Tax=Physcomitrium patens TaxID=3218 RepID=A0A2K1JZD4_PHYPA|nr:hypothetical protein PHYPA_014000 [Physcomitrium patens]
MYCAVARLSGGNWKCVGASVVEVKAGVLVSCRQAGRQVREDVVWYCVREGGQHSRGRCDSAVRRRRGEKRGWGGMLHGLVHGRCDCECECVERKGKRRGWEKEGQRKPKRGRETHMEWREMVGRVYAVAVRRGSSSLRRHLIKLERYRED